MNEAQMRYSTAKEYVEGIKLVITSPHYHGQHVEVSVRPTHLLAGFATELYFKSWLLGDGMPSDEVRRFGHKLLDLHRAARDRGFPDNNAIKDFVERIAEPHGQSGDFVYRYTQEDSEIRPFIWPAVLPIFDTLDVIVDTHVGASASHGRKPVHAFPPVT